MDRLNGVLVVLAGTVVGAYTGLLNPLPGSQDTARDIPRIRAPSGLESPAATTTTIAKNLPGSAFGDSEGSGRIRVFSPSAPLLAAVETANFKPTVLTLPRQQTSTWTAVITPSTAGKSTLSSPRAGDAATRAALASDLQQELKRVGCYGGEINGAWTESTRHAMRAFMERVNATLPLNEPDYILLTLVQGQKGQVCGAGCPAGQVEAASGTCLPEAVVAARRTQHERQVADAGGARKTTGGLKASSAGAYGSNAAPARAKSKTWTAIVRQTLPWLEQDRETQIAATTEEPLPGRMSIGGPVPANVKPRTAPTASGGAIAVPAPRQAIPSSATTRQAALQPDLATTQADAAVNAVAGLPGTKAGAAIGPKKSADAKTRASKTADRGYKRRNARYASGFGGRGRRGQPRMGTGSYNVMLSLGGVY